MSNCPASAETAIFETFKWHMEETENASLPGGAVRRGANHPRNDRARRHCRRYPTVQDQFSKADGSHGCDG